MLILQIIKNIALACSEFFFLAGGGKKSKMHFFFCSVEVSHVAKVAGRGENLCFPHCMEMR